jgi:hypothetical protein
MFARRNPASIMYARSIDIYEVILLKFLQRTIDYSIECQADYSHFNTSMKTSKATLFSRYFLTQISCLFWASPRSQGC